MSEKCLDFIGGHSVVAKRLLLDFRSSLHGRHAEFFSDSRNVSLVLIENFIGISNACDGRGLRLRRGSGLNGLSGLSGRVSLEKLLEILESLLVVEAVALEFHPIAVIGRHSAGFPHDIHNAVFFKSQRRKRVSCKRRIFLKNAA